MKWCVDFPEESILMVRPSLDALCHFVKPAAKLLGVLLYRYSIRQEHQQDAENINEVAAAGGKEGTQDTSFYIYRRQSQLVADMVDEMTEKTLHDVAIPTLQLLGYLDVDETPIIHKYDLHIDVVREALAAYKKNPVELFEFLLGHLQLEKFLIDEQLEEVLINKKKFSLALEKVLIANRNSSNNKRGRKTRQERAAKALSDNPKISIEIDSKISNKEREGVSADASTPPAFSSAGFWKPNQGMPVTYNEALDYLAPHGPHEGLDAVQVVKLAQKLWVEAHEEDDGPPTEKAPAIKLTDTSYHIADSTIGNIVKPALTLPSKTPLEQTPGTGALPSSADPPVGSSSGITRDQATPSLLLGPEPAQASSNPPAATGHPAQASGDQVTGASKETAKQKKARLERRRDEIIALHCQLLGRNVVRSKDELEGARLMAEAGSTDAEITITYNRYKKDKFWGHQLTLKNVAKLLDTTVANDTSVPQAAKPKTRPKPEDRNISIYETDPSWQVWQRPGDDQEWIWWQGEFWTPDEADDRGYNGGGGLYIQTQYAQGV